MSVFFRFAYLTGRKPWDSGIPVPELVQAVEGPGAPAPGRAIDLGCGTGTNTVYLAEHGWRAVGVDFVPQAIAQARRRAAGAGVWPRLAVGDVTRLDELNLGGGYGLLLDLGCYHTIPAARRPAYAAGVSRLAEPGAILLLFGFAPGARAGLGPTGVSRDELRWRLPEWDLEEATRGTDQIESWWYRLRRR
jgi:SAM-dependent methyltransferase